MASVPIVIVGTIKDSDSEEEKQVTICGLASIQGLSVGGGPIYPPANPPGIWGGGNVPMPTPPIQLPPWLITGGQPPHIWGGGNVPMPTPPIANVPGLPPMGPNWPPGGGGGDGEHEPKFEAKVAWTPETGWVVVFVPLEGTLVPTPSK